MTKIIILILCVVPAASYCQNEVLPVGESGKYTFYEVVEAAGLSHATLLYNASEFLKDFLHKKYRSQIKEHTETGGVSAKSHFLVYKKGSLGKHVDGAISYTIQIEVKDQKYRYVISDFVFQEYEKNRYGKFQPVKGKTRPMERASSNINKWQWDEHKATVREKMDLLIEELKLNMQFLSKQETKTVEIGSVW